MGYMLIAVYGEDVLRVQEFADDFIEKYIQKYDPARMNIDRFVFGKDEEDVIWQTMQAAPFMTEKRLVVVRGAVDMKKESAERWVVVLARVPSASVVMFVDEVSPDAWKKTQLVKLLEKQESPIEMKTYPVSSLSGSERISWIVSRAQKYGAALSSQLAQQILSRVGDDSLSLDGELRKLAAYANGQSITSEMITSVTIGNSEGDMFGFLDAVSDRRSSLGAEKFLQELSAGTDSFQLYSMLLRQIRILAQIDILTRSGTNNKDEIAKTLDLHPFVTMKAMQATKMFTAEGLASALNHAIDIEKQVKLGLDPEVASVRLLAAFAEARRS